MPLVTRDTVIDDRYRVQSRIGSGGMADVYVAEDLQLGRRVAVKLLHRRFAEDREFVERFRREASSAAGLAHPNVVQVYDRGEWAETYYIAMEYCEGRSLKQLIRDEGALDPMMAIDLAVQILRAAGFAHRRGIVHRDFKPHNVIVDDEWRAKVTDFGIARAGASDMTETGSIMGTAQYLSPEQAQGEPVSARSDLYSIGVMLYEMLTGRVPFDGESPVTVALKQVSEPPVPPSQVNPAIWPALEDVVLRAMEKDPERRFADADEFIGALEYAREHHDGPGRPPAGAPAVAPPEPGPERRPPAWLVALVALLVLAAVGVGLYLVLKPDQGEVPNVVGQRSSTAAAVLNNAGFKPDIQRVQSERAEDTVIRQDPSPGDQAEEGSTVTMFVSSGPGTATVPAVAGRSESDATNRLEDAGFDPRAREQQDDTVPSGRVISSTPPEGTQAERGSTVTLLVSSGPGRVSVPDVGGLGRDEAERRLEDQGLEATVREQESADEEPGTVLAQDPAGGTRVAPGSTVTLTVARAPARTAVPDVTGEDVNDAVKTLSDAGFTVRQEFQDVPTEDGDNVVLEQDPAGGEPRSRGARVLLTIGRFTPPGDGAEPTPTPTPTPAP